MIQFPGFAFSFMWQGNVWDIIVHCCLLGVKKYIEKVIPAEAYNLMPEKEEEEALKAKPFVIRPQKTMYQYTAKGYFCDVMGIFPPTPLLLISLFIRAFF